jgi:hypothetical protein
MTKTVRALVVVTILVSLGCSQNQQAVAYKTVGTLIVAVDTAMQAYAQRVGAGKVSAADQEKVKRAYGGYYDAIQVARTAIVASSGQAPPPEALATAAAALLDLLRGLGVKTS